MKYNNNNFRRKELENYVTGFAEFRINNHFFEIRRLSRIKDRIVLRRSYIIKRGGRSLIFLLYTVVDGICRVQQQTFAKFTLDYPFRASKGFQQ